MKLTRAFSLLLALIMALCVLAACDKAPDLSGPGDKEGEFSIPTELSYSLEMEGAKMSVKINAEFKENELSLVMRMEQSKGEFSQTKAEKVSFLLDEYGNVVRQLNYDLDTLRSADDYSYGENGVLKEERSHSVDSAPSRFTAYTAGEGDALNFTQYSSWGASDNGTLTRSYDEQGRLLSRTSSYGVTVSYEYDDNGNAVKQTRKYSDGETSTQEFKNGYSSGRLKSITTMTEIEEGVEKELTLSVGSYKSFKMTKGQYVNIMLMLINQDAELFRGESAGSGEIRYADGTVYKKTEQNGNTTKETYYLPEGKLDYICETVYENGKLRSKTFTDAEGEVTLSLTLDENGNPAGPYD